MNRLRALLQQANIAHNVAQLWLLAGLLCAIAPHLPQLPLLISLPCLVFIGWRLLHDLQLAPLPTRLTRWLLTLVALSATLFSFHTILGRQAGVGLLVVMMGLKLMEMNSHRDFVIVAGLGYFITLTVFMFDQSLYMGVYLCGVVFLLTCAQISQAHAQRPHPQRHDLRKAATLLLQAAPVALLLFILFPRIPGPLWNLPNDTFSASTGLSDSLSPGNITQLNDNAEVAFRVQFDDPLPPQDERYWRGPVFMEFDGRSWSNPYNESLRPDSRSTRPLNLVTRLDYVPGNAAVNYQVTLEPHRRFWLFALDLPGQLPEGSWLTTDAELITSKPVTQLQQYRIFSHTQYQLEPDLRPARSRYLQLPPTGGSRARALARSFAQQAGTAPATIDLMLRHIREQPFYYTRQPPPLPDDPIDEFLFDTRRGYCEHYASAFAYLARAAGIPARVVTGYLGGEMNPVGDYFIVRQSDAHAWTEVWLAGRGWVRVDPTAMIPATRVENVLDVQRLAPGTARDVPLPAWTTRVWRQFGYGWDNLNHYWNQWIINYNQRMQQNLLRALGLGDIDWRGMVTLLLGSVAAVVLFFALRLLGRRPPRPQPVVVAYRRFCRKLARRGIVRAPQEGALDFSRRAAQLLPEQQRAIQRITALYHQARYARQPADDTLGALRQAVAQFRP